MSMKQIREWYEVPAKRGLAVVYDGVPVVIVGSTRDAMHLLVKRTDIGDARTFPIHPTWRVDYPEPASIHKQEES